MADPVHAQLGTIAVVDTATGRLIRTVRFGKPHATTIAIATAPSGDTMAVATQALVTWAPDTLSLFDDRSWRKEAAISSFGPIPVTTLVFSPDGSRLAVGQVDGAVSLWSVVTRTELLSFLGQGADIGNLAFDADGSQLLVSGEDSNRVFASSGPALATLKMPKAPDDASGPDVVFSHGTVSAFVSGLLGCSPDCEWDTWSWPGGRLLDRRIVTRDANLEYTQDGPAIAYFSLVRPGGNQWDAAIWSLTGHRLLRTIRDLPLGTVNGYESGANDAELTDDGQRFTVMIASPAPAGDGVSAAVRTYSLATGAVLARPTVRVTPPKGCPIDDEIDELGTGVALEDACGDVYGVELGSSRPPVVVDVGLGVASVDADATGTLVAAATWDGSVSVYSGRTGTRLFRVFVGTDQVTGVMFSPDGRYLVTSALNGDEQTWDATTGALLQIQHDPYDPAVFAFAPNGEPLTEDSDSSVRAWDLCTDCQNAAALARLGARAVVRPLTPAEQAQAGQG